ncbi:hypothetical protein J3R83DRAFT_42, partial [Lanmaoa asiatica]
PMIPFRSRSAQVHFILFASFALAALQNVTVDDAVLTGPVIPQYLPSMYYWDIGNACNGCLISPDPSMAYNGTWHDSYYSPAAGVAQKISFNFTGTALYIFFIMANNITGAATLTNIEFVLDGIAVGQYTHTPLATTDYQYNVPVYANGGMTSGEHAMTIQPANSQNNMLMLFDYLIYSSASPSVQATSTLTSTSAMSTSPLLPTSSGTQGTSPKQNIGAIVGGTVGGVAALVLIAASLSCYRRYKRHVAGRPPADDGAVDPFISSREVAPTYLIGVTSSTGLVGSPFAKPTSRVDPSTASPQPSIPPATTTASSSSDRLGIDPDLHGQVELLWGEVARLRNLQHLDRNSVELRSEAPPEYS